LNNEPLDLCLLSSYDYRCEPLAPGPQFYLIHTILYRGKTEREREREEKRKEKKKKKEEEEEEGRNEEREGEREGQREREGIFKVNFAKSFMGFSYFFNPS
jgi:hypothetical protein